MLFRSDFFLFWIGGRPILYRTECVTWWVRLRLIPSTLRFEWWPDRWSDIGMVKFKTGYWGPRSQKTVHLLWSALYSNIELSRARLLQVSDVGFQVDVRFRILVPVLWIVILFVSSMRPSLTLTIIALHNRYVVAIMSLPSTRGRSILYVQWKEMTSESCTVNSRLRMRYGCSSLIVLKNYSGIFYL